MLAKKTAFLALTFGLAISAFAPISFTGSAPDWSAAFARGGDDGGCHPDDRGPCRHGADDGVDLPDDHGDHGHP